MATRKSTRSKAKPKNTAATSPSPKAAETETPVVSTVETDADGEIKPQMTEAVPGDPIDTVDTPLPETEAPQLNVTDLMANLEDLPEEGIVEEKAKPAEDGSMIPVQDIGTEIKPHQGTSVSQVIANMQADRQAGIEFSRAQQAAFDQNIPQLQGILNYIAKDIMKRVMQNGAGSKIVATSNSLVMERFIERQFSSVVSDTSYFQVNFTMEGEHAEQALDLFVVDEARPMPDLVDNTTVIEVVLRVEPFDPITSPRIQAQSILTIGIPNAPSPAAIYLMSVE
jgi:hypothetical protein